MDRPLQLVAVTTRRRRPWTRLCVAATGCVHKGRRYAAGAVWTTPGACVEQECGEDGAVTTTWCGHFMAGPNCRFVRGNLSAPYPECCPQLRCVKTTA
ncbi:uncharacterized protein LOC117646953 isoform X2 [Thrips palmi]|uniref:Uncharacterized protein LOC117646953 isoform X2 n=1 Tax=Thrips palmi TaxID=161013 RepID=A0A6P8ZPK1_THRPL|nr:uncharacterized protein LOC117646953 isoform X2 [Thrips palmi]